MESAKQRVSNMASAAKEKIHVGKAKLEERAEQATARTEEERQIATEARKVKEAEAKIELHSDKARHAAQKLEAKQHHPHIPGTAVAPGPGYHHIPGTGVAAGPGHHLPGTGEPIHQTYGAAGNIPPTTAHVYPGHPPAYNKHL